jgi:hypothetical protein
MSDHSIVLRTMPATRRPDPMREELALMQPERVTWEFWRVGGQRSYHGLPGSVTDLGELDSLFKECLEAVERDGRTESGVVHEIGLVLTPEKMERARFEATQRRLKTRPVDLKEN